LAVSASKECKDQVAHLSLLRGGSKPKSPCCSVGLSVAKPLHAGALTHIPAHSTKGDHVCSRTRNGDLPCACAVTELNAKARAPSAIYDLKQTGDWLTQPALYIGPASQAGPPPAAGGIIRAQDPDSARGMLTDW
jgi:hypothetical protein